MELRVATWNLHQGGLPAAWDALVQLSADVVLVQEAAVPSGWVAPAGVRAHPPIDRPNAWRSTGGHYWSTGVVLLNEDMQLRPHKDLVDRSVDGPLEVGSPGHTGVLAACDVMHSGRTLATVASAYGMWERSDAGASISEATMHRILDDFLPSAKADESVLLAGDFNIWIQPYQGAVWPGLPADIRPARDLWARRLSSGE